MVLIAAADLHVAEQVVVGPVAVDGQVHGHRVEELLEVGHVKTEGLDGVEDGRQHRVLDRGAVKAGEEPVAPGAQGRRLAGPVQGRGEVVDDLVGVAGEPVQGMDVAALPAAAAGWPGSRCDRGGHGAAGSARRPRTGSAARRRGRRPVRSGGGHLGQPHRPPAGLASTPPAARRPEMSTIGTLTPGTVPMPAKKRPGTVADVGRPQPAGLAEPMVERERRSRRQAHGLPGGRVDDHGRRCRGAGRRSRARPAAVQPPRRRARPRPSPARPACWPSAEHEQAWRPGGAASGSSGRGRRRAGLPGRGWPLPWRVRASKVAFQSRPSGRCGGPPPAGGSGRGGPGSRTASSEAGAAGPASP